MLSYVIRGTAFDSSDHDYPPRCHPHTRTRFLEELQMRIRDASLGARIAWLRGAAGIGKSAIMQTLAETLAEARSPPFIFTTLFFSRPNKRSDPKKTFTTLAYGLAVLDFQYCQYVGRRLAADPTFLTKSLEEQFKCLFLVPFVDGHVKVGSQRWVVMLDGLDEIVDLIRDSIVHHADSMPFIWIIASRPEAHLKAPFARVEEETRGLWVLEIPMDSDESLLAVEVYLRAEFSKIRRNYSDLVPLSWPSENDFLALTTASNGLFIFASTLASYIADHDPVVRLRELIPLLSRHRTTVAELKKNPFAAIDLLYTTILSDIPVDTLFTTKMILGHCLLGKVLGDESSITPRELYLSEICNLLGLEQHAAYASLRKLHSVLRLPTPKEAERQNIEFLHASFSDFLQDQNRSQSYHHQKTFPSPGNQRTMAKGFGNTCSR
ncbi:hypothetical protein P691DRAFT_796521 [Macrolepiota fuliginosa MF-IS2]|uniref:NACHT domain-containing protein n=1 Tax=Macrolepiota fuliginosa MF-IS2 TaxID=1400762 RepID=A0A9P5X455_9AGAR|nr:hypothetical protein P691DRAFT_798080 [Macrolepiota fuliginosa MF-IS2]KAF9444483.1 hypothetical protein P691DRAFT_796521 [Macrolepiota fuliginosa MF-IS2]